MSHNTGIVYHLLIYEYSDLRRYLYLYITHGNDMPHVQMLRSINVRFGV